MDSPITMIQSDIDETIQSYENDLYLSQMEGHSLEDIETKCLKSLIDLYQLNDPTNKENTEMIRSKLYYLERIVKERFHKMIETHKTILQNKSKIPSQLSYLKNLELPEQRSQEWYDMRKRVLTASSLATALGKGHFDTRETILIEKTNREPKPYFTNDILQWGVKYEPIATWFYEYLYEATIVEFGLVPHPQFEIFAASPDGIVDEGANNPHMIGRMLEIKCPPKRDFTDKVPPHYWMQMQGQLETCDLEECDFLQVKILEYASPQDFKDDILNDEDGEEKIGFSHTGYPKGLTLTFYGKDSEGNTTYDYRHCPFFMGYDDAMKWYGDIIRDYKDPYEVCQQNWWFIKRYECTLVLRDREWWGETMPKIIDFWDDVLHYRKVGNEELIKKRDERRQKRRSSKGTKSSKSSKSKPTEDTDTKEEDKEKMINVIQIDKALVESFKTTNFLNTDSEDE